MTDERGVEWCEGFDSGVEHTIVCAMAAGTPLSQEAKAAARQENPLPSAFMAIGDADPPASPFHFRIRYVPMGGHVHCRMFSGTAREFTHGKNGDLVMTKNEFEHFRTLTMSEWFEFMPEDEMKPA